MPFSIAVTREFSASHQLRLYDGTLEPLHGHNWRVEVSVSADRLDGIGVVMDFHELQRMVDVVITAMHHRHLNELEAFASANPSAENVAAHVARALRLPPSVRLEHVRVWETWDCGATYRPGPGGGLTGGAV